MHAADSSLALLAHFDGAEAPEASKQAPTRGAGWVLQWSAAVAIFFLALCQLVQFGYCLATELCLSRAARAGALEATLPRATYRSVAHSVQRRLQHDSEQPPRRLRISVLHNGAPVRGIIQAAEGEQLSVLLEVPMRDVLPGWLRIASFWVSDSPLEARAMRRMPGRHLSPREPFFH